MTLTTNASTSSKTFSTSMVRVGICTRYLDPAKEQSCVDEYIQAVISCGACPLLFPVTENESVIDAYLASVDAVIIPGGRDVDPALYHEDRHDKTQIPHPQLDNFEVMLVKKAIALDKPLLGICRGLQLINVALGGSLYQDIPSELPHALKHNMHPDYAKAAHQVRVCKDTPLAKLWADILSDNDMLIGVNSRHHQAIKELAEGLKPMAYATDGILEAFYMPQARFVMAVQWHPELMCAQNASQKSLIASLVEACV